MLMRHRQQTVERLEDTLMWQVAPIADSPHDTQPSRFILLKAEGSEPHIYELWLKIPSPQHTIAEYLIQIADNYYQFFKELNIRP